ncbi:unnamed protein product [Mytilus coruscus]|uniref:Uncharacterized protein n=1 Tax=Mytilus coruscus TaxID=42192 RepID=A0A6J8BDM8_MYTCO|nr:unnamed protein product [Mytilus coruscus]
MAALTTEGFQEAQPSGLDLFSLPPTQTAVSNMYYDEQRSTSQLTGNAPIEFTIAAQNSLEYVDLKRSKLYLRVRIKHADGSFLKATEYVGPVNLFLQSLFSQVDVTIQKQKSQLTTQLWIKDKSGHYDDCDVKNGTNASLYNRSLYLSESQTCDLEGPLLHDLFNLDRYILNGVAINVKLYRSRPEFCLLTNEANPNFEVVIEDIALKVCKLQVNPSVITAHAEKLKSTNAKYPFTRTEVRLISIPGGRATLPAFTSMFEVTNKWMRDSGNSLNRDDIAGGNAFYCFDVEPNFSDEGHYLNLLKQGTCSIEAVFKKPLKKATACVVYAEYPSYFEINLERGIILE